MLNDLIKGDTLYLASGAVLKIESIRYTGESQYGVELTFQGFPAKSHYALNGMALPQRGRSAHDVVSVTRIARPFDITQLRAGDDINVSNGLGGFRAVFLSLQGSGRALVGVGESMAQVREVKDVEANLIRRA